MLCCRENTAGEIKNPYHDHPDGFLRTKYAHDLCDPRNASSELLPSSLLFMRRMSQAPFGAVKRVVGGADPYLGCPRFRSAPEMPRKERTEAETFSLQSCFDVSGAYPRAESSNIRPIDVPEQKRDPFLFPTSIPPVVGMEVL